ncbi:MAG: hypothetical protein EOM76_07170 [Sphingobacteriia bacterium]|nr:hypothetical protein [Sphingobacteriia bacterium]
MIENFENITQELSDDELRWVPVLIKRIKNRSKNNPIKSSELVAKMNDFAEKHNLIRINDVKLRKIVNHIRSNGLAPIVATSEGYYTATDTDEIEAQIRSLTQRASSIMRCADGLRRFLNP